MEKTWLDTHNNNLEQMKKAFDKMEVKPEEIKANNTQVENQLKELREIINSNGEK